jgi:PAS domain S-box-containing protein
MQLGAARFIVKPIENEAFIAILREVLQAHQAGQLAAPQPLLEEETAFYRLYNEALIRKLEDKMFDLEQANRSLAESEARFRRLAENAQDLIYRYEFTPRRGFTYVNPAATIITGYTPEEHYADPDLGLKLVYPDDRPLLEAYFQGGGRFHEPIVLRWVRKDGQIIWTEQRNVPIFDEAGTLIAIEGIARDITERKQADEALERRVAQLALLNEVGSKIAAVSDLESVLERVARLVHNFRYHHAALYILDRERGDLVMRARAGGFAHIFPPEHRVRLGEGIVGWVGLHGETLLANDVGAEPRYVNFFPGVLPTRSKLCVSIRVGEEIVGVLDVQSDQLNAFDENDVRVLETLAAQIAVAFENARLYRELRQYAEELERHVQERTAQLYSQYARLEAILNSTSDGILVTGSQGQILLTNPVAQTWLTQTLPAEDVERLEATVRDLALRAEERPEAILELTGLDLQLNAAPITEPGLEGARAIVAFHDVSHLKALDRLKSQFVSNVSHELRTPVTTIKLYAALLRQNPPEKWPRYLDALEKEADRQARLVEDILQVARIDVGRLEIKPQAVNLNGLAEDVVAGRQALAQARGLALECCLVEPGPVVLVDPERMMQVLNNLVENAIHYTPQGRIEVATGQAEAEGRAWATVRVSDTGMGIPEEDLLRLFERFYRGEKARQSGLPGTGLGLAIAKEIVDLHGGGVTVESREGVGRTFTGWLPLAEE